MRRLNPVRSQEDLKSDIFCLKRQLAVTADENQLLKVKIRKLENELRRKEKYIECLWSEPQKDREIKKFLYDKRANMIHKLQKRNEELENLLLNRDTDSQKRYNELKTMRLYSHMDYKTSRKGSKGSLSSLTRLNSEQERHLNSQNSFDIPNNVGRFDSKKPGRLRSSDSLKNHDYEKRKNHDYVNRISDYPASQRRKEAENEAIKVAQSLQEERNAEKRIIHSKNAEIFRLSDELNDLKNRLSRQSSSKVTKSTSTTQLQEMQCKIVRDAPNFIEENKRNVSRIRVKNPQRKLSRNSVQYWRITERKVDEKLTTVEEQNEELCSPIESYKTTPDASNEKTAKTAPSRPKTRIEYVFDSEVSSDGEEVCLPSNLRTFLQRTVNTTSTEVETSVNSH